MWITEYLLPVAPSVLVVVVYCDVMLHHGFLCMPLLMFSSSCQRLRSIHTAVRVMAVVQGLGACAQNVRKVVAKDPLGWRPISSSRGRRGGRGGP